MVPGPSRGNRLGPKPFAERGKLYRHTSALRDLAPSRRPSGPIAPSSGKRKSGFIHHQDMAPFSRSPFLAFSGAGRGQNDIPNSSQ